MITSIGSGRDIFWRNLLEGRQCIDNVSTFDTSKYRIHKGAVINDFNPPSSISGYGRCTQLAIEASTLAIKDADLDANYRATKRRAVFMGAAGGEGLYIDQLREQYMKGDWRSVSQKKIEHTSIQYISAGPAQVHDFPSYWTLPNACASGNYALGFAFDALRSGQLDLALAGGAEEFSRIIFGGFQSLGNMTSDLPRPFDRNRTGLVAGEGAAVLALENLTDAKRRNARIYAEVMGYGLNCDTYHMTTPDPSGVAISKVIDSACMHSRISKHDVDYISAHGTSTVSNDAAEAAGIRKCFPDRYRKIPVSSIKGALGHTFGASSAIESCVSCLIFENGVIPPTLNYETPDPEIDLDVVPNHPRELNVKVIINNAFGFGGNNACVILKKYE
jgi:3-oxoacyl-[acyl-carrier-protein] synthase II